MAKLLLLTDSNFINNVGIFSGRKIENLDVKSCQSKAVAMGELSEFDEGIVVIACLDMIAAEAKSSGITGADLVAESSIYELKNKIFEKVNEAKGALAIGVIAPLFWASLPKNVLRSLNHSYRAIAKESHSHVIMMRPLLNIQAGADGTHLTRASAQKYIEHVFDTFSLIASKTGLGPVVRLPADSSMNSGEAFEDFDAVMELLPPDDELGSPIRSTSMMSVSILGNNEGRTRSQWSEQMVTPTRVETMLPPALVTTRVPTPFPAMTDTQQRLTRLALPSLAGFNAEIPPPVQTGLASISQGLQQDYELRGTIARIERKLGSLESKSFHDNIVMATIREDQDTEANKAMLNKVNVSGIELPNLQRITDAERIKIMRDKIAWLVDKVKQSNQVLEVTFVKHLNRQVQGGKPATLEVRFGSDLQALDFRKAFVKFMKENNTEDKEMKAIHVAPAVRLATKVRIEILKSVANLMKTKDSSIDKAFCVQFVPKPIIKIVRKTRGGSDVARTYTFIQAVSWVVENGYKDLINLKKAHERAGASFRGILSQLFVIM